MKKNVTVKDERLLDLIIETIKSKKGKEIVSIDLTKINNSVCDYFVICHGDSTTQVGAITDEVRKKAKEVLNVSVDHIEGAQNSLWVLMDFSAIVVHIFLKEQRIFYHLEDLWADGIITKHEDN
jgi:ribosome-associated protein